ncbi:hypothetical protein DOTSEDRAFT_56924 [Dothistroma septosporum NZE10]|uniref:Uncharacterized protein n=1 Tax=Dothistroma septosporum (strain NZE10 / CBS 128990) TaxID=675120 RepID=M2YL44_DOTSN|nr:hypothetical protein DOTSEDRAFT_56924 [Dothistroma septosporum NZE10]
MSSFFTLPTSQKKRKRAQGDAVPRATAKNARTSRAARDESISGSDVSDDEGTVRAGDVEDKDSDEEEDFIDEDPGAKRLRLAEQYLKNTQKEVEEEVGFDAKDVDQENLRRRMGERLKEDTAETRGKLYRWIAQELDWSKAERGQVRHHQKSMTGVAISGEHVYTVGKDAVLVKWLLPSADRSPNKFGKIPSRKPQKVLASGRSRKNTHSNDVEQHTMAILCVAASQDGKFVATGGADKKLIVWDAATLKPLRVFPSPGQRGHRDAIIGLAFRRGTNQLYSASKDRTINTYSLDELSYVETLFGHQDEVVDVGALATETCVTVGARDRTARFWKIVEESQLVFRGGGAPKKDRFANSNDSGIYMADDEPAHEGSTDRVACIDDDTFVTGSDNGSISLWNIHKKKAVHVYPLAHGMDPPLPLEEVSAEVDPPEEARTKPQARWITALRAIPYSDTFVSGSWDGYLRVWKISADKRRIEAVGRIGSTDLSVEELLKDEDLDAAALSNDALNAMIDGSENHSRIHGIINDLAIADRGERAKDGVVVVAAVGKESRLGRWRKLKDATNCLTLFDISRKLLDGESSSDTLDVLPNGNDDFAGFD